MWLSNPSDVNSSFVTFRFKAVLFGATCLPFLLNAALSHHLTHNSITSRGLLNVVSGPHTEAECLDYFVVSRSLLGNAIVNLIYAPWLQIHN